MNRRSPRYENMDGIHSKHTVQDFLRWRKERSSKQMVHEEFAPYAKSADYDNVRSNRTERTFTWVGHSTFLIQEGGLHILTDPVWSQQLGLERRLTRPGIPLQELPAIDVVLISHSHYDHLHFGSLRKLPGEPIYLVPTGLKRKFEKKGFTRTEEFKWWETFSVNGLSFTFVPAQHWSKRTLLDTNRSHWGGWMIGSNIYFAGDSGYFRGFREIGESYDVKIALLPIGAYEPEWFMHIEHMTPEEAVEAYVDLGAELFIPMHYGTFRLADDTPQEALERLQSAWERRKLDPERLLVLKLGEHLYHKDIDVR